MGGRVLIVDDVATNRIALKARLSGAFYEVMQAADGATALRLARQAPPDLVLLDLIMSGMDGIEVCRALRAAPETADIPVIMITAEGRFEEKLRALKAGADDYLSKPVDEVILLARMRSLMRARETARELAMREETRAALGLSEAPASFAGAGRIVLIAPGRAEAVHWKHALAGRIGAASIEVGAIDEALRPPPPGQAAPDLYFVAAGPGRGGDGLALLPELRARAFGRDAAIVMAVPAEARESAAMALDLGANDLVTLPFDARELALRLSTQLARKKARDRLRASVEDGLRLAVTDPLTGLVNRRYALPHLGRLLARRAPGRPPVAAMMVDIDRFKALNDAHGHAGGDAVLVAVARRLCADLRPADLVARVGGDEFLVVLAGSGAGEAARVAERMRRRVSARPVAIAGGGGVSVSLSIGLAVAGDGETGAETLVARADRALYAAKTAGRNRVERAPSPA